MREVKFNGIALAELNVTFLENPAKVVGKGAFINTQTGQTHGWTTCHQWSPETMIALREVRALMERDMAAIHFTDGAQTPAGSTTGSVDPRGSFRGLGENLGAVAEDVPPA